MKFVSHILFIKKNIINGYYQVFANHNNLYAYLVSEERPDDYEKRLDFVDLEKIISLSELFILESLPLYDINKQTSSEPLKHHFLIELQCLSDKLKWYGVICFVLISITSVGTYLFV